MRAAAARPAWGTEPGAWSRSRPYPGSLMAAASQEITRILDGARRRQGGIVVATALGWGATVVLALLLAGATWLTLRPDAGRARASAVGLAFAAATAAVAWGGLALRRRTGPAESVARVLGDAVPPLRSDLVSAVELARDGAGFSPALVEEHVARTAARAAALDLRIVVPSVPARRAGSALALAAFLNLLALAAAGPSLRQGYARLLGLGPEGKLAPSRAPITGDVELTYRYPAYMRREPRTLSGTGGELHAPKGTEVTLKTRADRDVREAQLVLSAPAAPPAEGGASPATERLVPLQVAAARELAGQLVVGEPGTYRFRFTNGKKVLAEGPPLPISIEPDLAPEVRIVQPKPELEVQPGAKVPLAWTASDDFGLGTLTLVVRRDGATKEERAKLKDLSGLRRDGGTETLDVAALRLVEGERIQYWLEATDEDTVSGPKRGVSATHVLKIYSEAEHRRLAVSQAKELWEALIGHAADRLDFFAQGPRRWDVPRVQQAQGLDGRTVALGSRLTEGAAAMRRDRAAPRELAQALANVGASVSRAGEDVTQLRESLARTLAFQRGDAPLVTRLAELDRKLDGTLESGILYLEKLMDQERADDLVRLAKELQARRRDLAALAEKVRDAPTAEHKQQLLAEVQALRRRMDDLARRMAELAKGMNDEHLNTEALAEAAKAADGQAQLDEIEKEIREGHLDRALAKLDELGARMDELVAGMQRAQKRPGEQSRELARDLRQLRDELGEVERQQQRLAGETGQEKQAYQREVARRLKDAEGKLARLRQLTRDAREKVDGAQAGVTPRAESDFEQARDRLADLDRALATKDLDAAREAARRAALPVERLAAGLDEDLAMLERFPQLSGTRELPRLRAARDEASQAVPPAREVRDQLERMFPEPRDVLPREAQARLDQQARRQGDLARRANELRRRMEELAAKAPVFPPQAGDALRDAEQQMDGASGELARRDPQRGAGRQQQALDALQRFRQGMEKMAGASGQGQGGMPMPFAMESGGQEEGDGLEASPEKVEIPGAEAWKAPEAFRRDLMEAMKQGKPKSYEDEVSRYYRELVK